MICAGCLLQALSTAVIRCPTEPVSVKTPEPLGAAVEDIQLIRLGLCLLDVSIQSLGSRSSAIELPSLVGRQRHCSTGKGAGSSGGGSPADGLSPRAPRWGCRRRSWRSSSTTITGLGRTSASSSADPVIRRARSPLRRWSVGIGLAG
jgi:hypothetical protein